MFSSSRYSAAQLSGMRAACRARRRSFRTSLGFRGFYKGLGTVLVVRCRLILNTNLSALWAATALTSTHCRARRESPQSTRRYLALPRARSPALATQTVTVPMDVVSQRLIVQKKSDTRYANGLQLAMWIVRNEGFRQGLYGYQLRPLFQANCNLVGLIRRVQAPAVRGSFKTGPDSEQQSDTGATTSEAPGACCLQRPQACKFLQPWAQATSIILTTPLDVLKVRMQVQETLPGVSRPGVVRTFRTDQGKTASLAFSRRSSANGECFYLGYLHGVSVRIIEAIKQDAGPCRFVVVSVRVKVGLCIVLLKSI
ncbi:hypothetical protein FVE85_9458 [Porphyridium purpureum]|uniref:Uncharacterized protein n=1 Tax=Porphyridium purpureum TaxID=35688 RepID=A0A5J4YKL5_PORPP|nr:hypothetical protein FVE85_9458 [Porphyridium purpureum]|eukprot:POR2051..scf261_15